jgi:signal peptidase I
VTQVGDPTPTGQDDDTPAKRPRKSSSRKPQGFAGLVRETVILMVLAIGLAVLFKTFLVQAFYIPSGSMEQTLEISDRVLVEKLSYRFGDVHHGDIVVFIRDDELLPPEPGNPVSRLFGDLAEAVGLVPPSERDFIKRVIGLPGDRISCRDGHVLRNDQPISEPYLDTGTITDCEPVAVPSGQLFVMGDNRGNSQDSRVFGPIDRSDVVGRAFVRLWPLNRMGWLRRDR